MKEERKIVKCRSCGADIFWNETANGRKMPLDAKELADTEVKPNDIYIPSQDGIPRFYRTHFATCPNAKQHRKAS